MRIAYGDLIGGVSGDMFVAALLDSGLPLASLKAEVKKIPTLKFDLKASKKTVSSIRALQFHVTCPKQETPRTWRDIRQILQRSRLSAAVKETGIEIFRRLAEAEAKVHGVAVDRVHFHEVGATDSIVDIMAASIGSHQLRIRAFHFSRVPLGRGFARSGHGLLPVPGPATLELLKDIPVEWTQLNGETVTPTGAAIIATLGKSFGAEPRMSVEKIGYGAGAKEWPDRPNLFRLVLGEDNAGRRNEEMVVLETNIDDMNPQFYDHVMDRLFAAGARDVFLAPIQMKKNRPATLMTVICEPTRRAALAEIILRETSTIGVRYYLVSRMVLRRESKQVPTRFGRVAVKLVEQPDGTKRASPEYDDLRRIAAARKLPLRVVHDAVMRALGK